MDATKQEVMNHIRAESFEFVDGATQRFCHNLCGDTRNRLYITKAADKDNTFLYFCHNCQESGAVYVVCPFGSTNWQVPGAAPAKVRDLCTLDDFGYSSMATMDPENIPTVTLNYFSRFSNVLSLHTIIDAKVRVDPHTGEYIIPMYDTLMVQPLGFYPKGPKEPYGYTRRSFNGLKGRYQVSKEPNTEAGTILKIGCKGTRLKHLLGVIVEDYFSGLACIQAIEDTGILSDTRVCVLVNYGVNCKPFVLKRFLDTLKSSTCIHTHKTKVCVWLDNDSEIVKRKAQDMANVLGLMDSNLEIKMVNSAVEPKYSVSEADIRNQIIT